MANKKLTTLTIKHKYKVPVYVSEAGVFLVPAEALLSSPLKEWNRFMHNHINTECAGASDGITTINSKLAKCYFSTTLAVLLSALSHSCEQATELDDHKTIKTELVIKFSFLADNNLPTLAPNTSAGIAFALLEQVTVSSPASGTHTSYKEVPPYCESLKFWGTTLLSQSKAKYMSTINQYYVIPYTEDTARAIMLFTNSWTAFNKNFINTIKDHLFNLNATDMFELMRATFIKALDENGRQP